MIFKNNVTIITGASTGIGEELAYRLAEQGALLVLTARREAELERVAAKVRELGAPAGARVIIVSADVGVEADCKKTIDAAVKEFGRIDTLVNNAGMTMWAKFADIRDVSMLERIMQVNYMGAVYCTHYALPYLRETGGRIVGIASLTRKIGGPTRSGYSPSTHAMAGVFASLAAEVAPPWGTPTLIYPRVLLP